MSKHMLISLYIENIILIEKLRLDLYSGLMAITGESGAGKSVILDSINIILGDRASQSILRTGTNKGLIVAEFDISDNIELINLLNEYGYEINNVLIIKKIINRDSASKIFINDIVSNVQFVRKITDNLIEIHGQMEQSEMFNPAKHIEILDRYSENGNLLKELKIKYGKYRDLLKSTEQMKNDLEIKQNKLQELKEMKNDLDKYDIKENEENELIDKRTGYLQNQKIQESISNISSMIDGTMWSKVSLGIEKFVTNYDQILTPEQQIKLNEKIEIIDNFSAEIEDLSNLFSSIENERFSNTNKIEKIEERVDQIKEIARKYRIPSSELFHFARDIENQIRETESLAIDVKNAEKELDLLLNGYFTTSKEITKRRQFFGEEISIRVITILQRIGMEKAFFKVEVDFNQERISENGSDNVKFMANFNPGMEIMPIEKIASGGEISRLMLALKEAISLKIKDCGVVIFDEIESGLSGKTCQMIAKELTLMSKNIQIIVITHNPYIAGHANNHFRIYKKQTNEVTTTYATNLTKEERIIEISSMISGDEKENSLNLAKEIMNKE